jgi:hypothetical protein
MNRHATLPRNATEAILKISDETGIKLEIPETIVNTFDEGIEFSYIIEISHEPYSQMYIKIQREKNSYSSTYTLM